MRNLFVLTCTLLLIFGHAFGQEHYESSIPPELITNEEEGGVRSGSCGSPDGAIMLPELGGYPTYAYLSANGYCFPISPPVKNATYCFTFTSIGTTAVLDSGFSFVATGGYSLWFNNFNLYTCAPSCTPVGTGLSFTGLTPGQCYTWCFDTHMTGGGPGGGFTTMCPYYIYTVPLPIVLSSFSCHESSDGMQINWKTLSEINSSHFEILKSSNAVDFEKIGTVKGNGTTSSEHVYAFTDTTPSEENYYRLRQVDFNGGSTDSEIISCGFEETIESVNYYNLLGESIDIEDAGKGVFIKETVMQRRKSRQLFYKSN